MALYINTNVSSIDMSKSSNSAQTTRAGDYRPAENSRNTGISEEVVDITDSLSSILSALGVNKSQLKTSMSDQIDKTASSELNLRDKNSVADAVKSVQNNLQNQGAASILAQANQNTLYALSILED